ncbi:class I SAM-dependent methyltransferase [Marininema halotolerans]|uniref:Methyltransferase domain-containing protein n=1 Tax=Marininema halotolerans TaxID=1155944 RepID=A0A1I6UEV7_9BACL|nr:class I SAM-dependent methyltransferase [Marininema halotolerans]SFS99965.1 Methyltransferase domain-containing protein [Marininema halotolerans]
MVHSMYQFPEYYDWTSDGLHGDENYYRSLAQACQGPVLELGSGTGRITLSIAQLGIKITGVDSEPLMVQAARKKGENVGLSDQCQWIEENMTTFELGEKFPLIIIPYRSFLHLTTERDQRAALDRIHQHLTDEGLLAFNIFVPHPEQLVEEDERFVSRGSYPIPGSKDIVEVTDFTRFSHFFQRGDIWRYYERLDETGRSLERIRTNFSLRYIYPVELGYLLHTAGFEITARWGGFQHEPFGPRSQELVVEARKLRDKG